MVAVLEVAGGLLVACIAPVVPAYRTDMTAHFAVDEECVGVWTPWTAQINLCGLGRGGEAALMEHVAILLTGWCGRGCDIAVGLAVDFAVLEPGDGRTEDEVCCSLDVAVVEGDACAGNACIYGVLIA